MPQKNEGVNEMDRDIHTWFNLTYANYLVIPRSVMQSMPEEWQFKFVALLEKMDETGWRERLPDASFYQVEMRNDKHKVADPFREYDRGRRDVFKEVAPLGAIEYPKSEAEPLI
jgi:hypothetical protein